MGILNCGCKVSHVGASFPTCTCLRQDGILSPQREVTESFPMWVQVFQLALPRQDGILSPQRDVGASFPMWVRVFNLHFPDKMKSRRHKTYRNLTLDWFRTGGGDLIGRRRGIQRQGETDRQKSLWHENAARHRNRTVSPDGELCPSRKYPTDSAEEPSSEGSFSQWEKGHHNCKSRG